jgi:hypothetical protein
MKGSALPIDEININEPSQRWRDLLIGERIWELTQLEFNTNRSIIDAGLSHLPQFRPEPYRVLTDQAGDLRDWGEFDEAEAACRRAEIALIERRPEARQAGTVLQRGLNTTLLTPSSKRHCALLLKAGSIHE